MSLLYLPHSTKLIVRKEKCSNAITTFLAAANSNRLELYGVVTKLLPSMLSTRKNTIQFLNLTYVPHDLH